MLWYCKKCRQLFGINPGFRCDCGGKVFETQDEQKELYLASGYWQDLEELKEFEEEISKIWEQFQPQKKPFLEPSKQRKSESKKEEVLKQKSSKVVAKKEGEKGEAKQKEQLLREIQKRREEAIKRQERERAAAIQRVAKKEEKSETAQPEPKKTVKREEPEQGHSKRNLQTVEEKLGKLNLRKKL